MDGTGAAISKYAKINSFFAALKKKSSTKFKLKIRS
jgi:hypothetical protein